MSNPLWPAFLLPSLKYFLHLQTSFLPLVTTLHNCQGLHSLRNTQINSFKCWRSSPHLKIICYNLHFPSWLNRVLIFLILFPKFKHLQFFTIFHKLISIVLHTSFIIQSPPIFPILTLCHLKLEFLVTKICFFYSNNVFIAPSNSFIWNLKVCWGQLFPKSNLHLKYFIIQTLNHSVQRVRDPLCSQCSFQGFTLLFSAAPRFRGQLQY